MIIIDWFNQSIKIDTHSPNGLNCYWSLLICTAKLRMIPCVLYSFLWRGTRKKTHIHVTHCFSSCAVFAFLRFFYDSLYYGVVALYDIPGKWSECCRVPCVCYSESTLHFPSNYRSVIFPFGCTGECSRCMLFCYIKAAYKLFVLVTL